MEHKPPQYTVEDDLEITTASSTKKDDSYEVYQRYRDSEFSPEETARVLRKIDIRLVPLLFAIYLIQYLDKNSLNFASVYGLKTGTKLEGQDYSWLGEHSLPLYLPSWSQGHCLRFFSKDRSFILDISWDNTHQAMRCKNYRLGSF